MANANDMPASSAPMIDRPSRGWQIVWGVLLILCGVLAAMMPAMAASVLVFAWLLIIGGGCEIAYAVQTRGNEGFGGKLASGMLTLGAGIAILVLPVAGVTTLGLLVGAFLLASGITRTVLALRLKPQGGWGLILIGGLLSIAIAILIAFGWPQSSLAFIGVMTGFWLISAGFWRIMVAGYAGT